MAATMQRVIPDAESLRTYLHMLNERGHQPTAVGVGDLGQPFLITLVGPYADNEAVFFDSPWQTDIGWTEGREHCEECGGWVHSINHIQYPVVILHVLT